MKKKKNKQPSEIDSTHLAGSASPSPRIRLNLLAGYPVRWMVLGCLTLLVVTTRFYSLETQGFHHDESIHCLHSWQVANQGPQTYRYNPIYHGPFLYHFGGMFHFFSQKETVGQPQESDRFYHHILPDEDWVGRVPFATMGVFLVLVFLFLHRQLGWGTVFLLVAMLILSPVVNYFSRFAREDVHQIAWLAGSIVFGFLYFQSKRVGYLTLVVVFMTLCYCTKENSYMNNFVLGSYVVLWGLFEFVRSPRSTLSRICLDYAPAVRFLVLFGCFSVFVFLYAALDSRVSPETGLWRGIKNILSHSTALTEKIDASALKQETGYFSATGREGTRAAYFRSAFASTTLLLFLFEILVLTIRRRIHAGPSPFPHFVRLGISLLFIGGLIASSVTISGWVQSVEREGFVTELFFRSAMQILGFGILAVIFIIPNRLIGRDGKSLFRETLDWWNLGIQLVLAQTIYLFLFTSMGTNIERGPTTGLYDYIAYWFKHQTGDFRIWGVWWYYLPRLFLYELLPLVLVLLVGISLLILSLRTGLSKWGLRDPDSGCLDSPAPDGVGQPYCNV